MHGHKPIVLTLLSIWAYGHKGISLPNVLSLLPPLLFLAPPTKLVGTIFIPLSQID